jgi:osmoprotectant transport system permease protein
VIAQVDDPLIDWGWIWDHLDDVWTQLLQHVELTVIAVVVGFLISAPLAVLSYRHRRFYAPVTWVTGLLYTIPSLALFGFLAPYLGYFSIVTAEVALISYTLLILIRNTVSGLRGVPEDVKEAARGMGYTDRQLLWGVELPLATPVIVAGLRIATVTTIGLVTITAVLDQGGLGRFILLGIQRNFFTASFLGTILSVLLALAADRGLLLAERRLTPWLRVRAGRE